MEISNIPSTGAMLRKYVDENRIRQAGWARKQNIKSDNVRKYLKRKSIRTDTLFKICHVLSYNFFYDLALALPQEFRHALTADQQRISVLEKEIETLRIQNELLERMVKGK